MFENFSQKAKEVVDIATTLSNQKGFKTVGTESLFYSLYQSKDSVCRYLFEDYDVTFDDIMNVYDQLIIIRHEEEEYNQKFLTVIKTAVSISLEQGTTEVQEEHLFFSLLLVKNTIFLSMIDQLGIELKDLLEDLRDVFDLSDEDDLEYTTNITKKAINNELDRFIGREDYLNRMQLIIERKNKNNPLLIGNAGVGKSALVEGLAGFYLKQNKDYEIISLNLGCLLSNTKYRGDFEAKIDKLTKNIIKKKNAILFIDEIHTIVGAGSSEGALDAANILKPFLARANFKVIGATTLEEYRKSIMVDKALNRRFQSIFVSEPTIKEMTDIMFGIRKDYEKFHKVKVPNQCIKYIIDESQRKIINRKFPDKAIDVLDESLSLAKLNHVKLLDKLVIDRAIREINGLKIPLEFADNFYKELNPLYLDYRLGVPKKVLGTVSLSYDEYNLKELKKEMMKSLGITDEMFLELDLSGYQESHSISSLIGSPKGYVGYDDGGILSEHIGSYPVSVVVLSNYNICNEKIKKFIDTIIEKGSFYDKKGNFINCNNLILLYLMNENNISDLGFIKLNNKPKSTVAQYNIVNKKSAVEFDDYYLFMKNKGYELSYSKEEFSNYKEQYLLAFENIINGYSSGSYSLSLSKDNQIEISNILVQ